MVAMASPFREVGIPGTFAPPASAASAESRRCARELRVPGLDPDLAREREALAVRREERRAGLELAAVLTQRPGDDDALLTLPGQPVDLRGHPAEHDLAPARPADGVGARAVDRG